jgi:hypothetical protein
MREPSTTTSGARATIGAMTNALALLALTSGCALGGGPVGAWRPSGGVAVGWEVEAGLPTMGLVAGQSIPISTSGSTGYGFVHYARTLDSLNVANEATQSTFAFGGSVGGAVGEGQGGIALGASAMHVTLFDNSCQR